MGCTMTADDYEAKTPAGLRMGLRMGRAKHEAPPWPPCGLLQPSRPTGAGGDWRAWAECLEASGAELHAELLTCRRALAQAQAKATRAKKRPGMSRSRGLLDSLAERTPTPRGRRAGSVHDKDAQRAVTIRAECKAAGKHITQAQAVNAARNERGARALHGPAVRAAVNLLSKAERKQRNSGR